MARDASFWVAVASSAAACIAALFAYLTARISKRSIKLAESQEERRQPKLVPYLFEAYYRPVCTEEYTIYAFSLSISNPSDIDNAIALLELQVNYKVSNATKMAVKVPHDPALSISFCDSVKEHFSLPARIDAHQRILIEVPDTHFQPEWERLFLKHLALDMRKKGLHRQQAKQAARGLIKELRQFGKFRMKRL